MIKPMEIVTENKQKVTGEKIGKTKIRLRGKK